MLGLKLNHVSKRGHRKLAIARSSAEKPKETLRPRQNCRHFTDDIFKCIFLNKNVLISLKIPLKFVPKIRINNIPALVQIMAWCRPADKPSSEAMVFSLLKHLYVTRPQCVNELRRCLILYKRRFNDRKVYRCLYNINRNFSKQLDNNRILVNNNYLSIIFHSRHWKPWYWKTISWKISHVERISKLFFRSVAGVTTSTYTCTHRTPTSQTTHHRIKTTPLGFPQTLDKYHMGIKTLYTWM